MGQTLEHGSRHPAGRKHRGHGDNDDQRRGSPPPRGGGYRSQKRHSVEGGEESDQQSGRGRSTQQRRQYRTEIRGRGRIDAGCGEGGAGGISDKTVVVDQTAADGDRGGGCAVENQIQITEESTAERSPHRERAGHVDALPPHRAGDGAVIELPVAEGNGFSVRHPETTGKALAHHLAATGRDHDVVAAGRIDGVCGPDLDRGQTIDHHRCGEGGAGDVEVYSSAVGVDLDLGSPVDDAGEEPQEDCRDHPHHGIPQLPQTDPPRLDVVIATEYMPTTHFGPKRTRRSQRPRKVVFDFRKLRPKMSDSRRRSAPLSRERPLVGSRAACTGAAASTPRLSPAGPARPR